MGVGDDERIELTRKAMLAVAEAAALVARTRTSIHRASQLMRTAAPQASAEAWTPTVRLEAARAVGELEVAGRAAERLAVDISSAGYSLVTAAGGTPDLLQLLPGEGSPGHGMPPGSNLVGRAIRATARSAALAEAARDAVERAASLVREAARAVKPEDWPRRIQADAAVVGVRAASHGAGTLADETESARRSITQVTSRIQPRPRVAPDRLPGRG